VRTDWAGRVGTLYWSERNIAYVVSGEATGARLRKVAETVYAQIERPPTP
jgi:anti-sigma factor RsiW